MKKENPTSTRSKRYLTYALLNLMEEKPFQKITIKEITEKAQLARMTFYSNFHNKEEILQYHSDCLLEEFIEGFIERNRATGEEMYLEFFQFWKREKKFLDLLRKNKILIFVKLFEKYIYELNDMFSLMDFSNESPEGIEYKVANFAGGLCNVLSRWVERDMKDDPRILVDMLTRDFKKK